MLLVGCLYKVGALAAVALALPKSVHPLAFGQEAD